MLAELSEQKFLRSGNLIVLEFWSTCLITPTRRAASVTLGDKCLDSDVDEPRDLASVFLLGNPANFE